MTRWYPAFLPHAWQKLDDFPQGGNLAVTNGGETTPMAMNYDARFDQIDAKINQMDAKFNQMNTKFNQMDASFNQMDAKIDQVLEAVLGLKQSTEAQFIVVDRRLDRAEARLTSVEGEVRGNTAAIDALTKSVDKLSQRGRSR